MNLMWENIFRRSANSGEIKDLLARNPLFEDLSKKELRFVETLVHERNYRPGEQVFRQGEVGVGMYMIKSGYIDISVDDLTGRGDESTIYITRLEPGDFFGEIALIEENGRRTANAVAHADSTLLGFFKPDLNELIDRNPVTGVKVLSRLSQVLGRRLRETSIKITDLKRELHKELS